MTRNTIPNLANPFNIFKLFTPLKHYHYFEQHDAYPFNPDHDAHDTNNAWWLAEFSSLAYHDKDFVKRKLHRLLGLDVEHITWIYGPENDTQSFIVSYDSYHIISFRGTEFYTPAMLTPRKLRSVKKDLMTDLKISKRTDALVTSIKVHQGFHDALHEIWPQISELISNDDKKIWFTGHSMGGAISTLAAARLHQRTSGVYTFGIPCLGDETLTAFCQKHLSGKIFRYVNENDFVANIMPKFMPEYQHCAQAIPVHVKKRRSPFEFLGDAFKLDIIDHSPLFYMLATHEAMTR